MKYNDEYLKTVCNEKHLQFQYTKIMFINGKNRRCCFFICLNHIDKGIQFKPIDKMEKIKTPCVYCNHRAFKNTFKSEIEKIEPKIEILGNYINYDTPILCRCREHNYKWKGLPSILLKGGGCKYCASEKRILARRKTTEKFKTEMQIVNSNIEIIGEYTGSHNYIECRCKLHNIKWKSYACNLLNKSATCPKCSKEHLIKSQNLGIDEFMNRLNKNYPHIQIRGDYINKNTLLKFYCNLHDCEFKTTPANFLYKHGRGCPYCNISSGEYLMDKTLLKLGFDIKTQYILKNCKYKNPLRFDAFDIENNIAFEFQGRQHYEPVNFGGVDDNIALIEYKKNKIRDEIKRTYCKNNNIFLLTIPYWEQDNMENYIKEVLKSNNIVSSCE